MVGCPESGLKCENCGSSNIQTSILGLTFHIYCEDCGEWKMTPLTIPEGMEVVICFDEPSPKEKKLLEKMDENAKITREIVKQAFTKKEEED